jgi:hypothetical protein
MKAPSRFSKNYTARKRPQGKLSRIYFQADAGFANPKVYEYLEAERIKYAIRLPANRVLQERNAQAPRWPPEQ